MVNPKVQVMFRECIDLVFEIFKQTLHTGYQAHVLKCPVLVPGPSGIQHV